MIREKILYLKVIIFTINFEKSFLFFFLFEKVSLKRAPSIYIYEAKSTPINVKVSEIRFAFCCLTEVTASQHLLYPFFYFNPPALYSISIFQSSLHVPIPTPPSPLFFYPIPPALAEKNNPLILTRFVGYSFNSPNLKKRRRRNSLSPM